MTSHQLQLFLSADRVMMSGVMSQDFPFLEGVWDGRLTLLALLQHFCVGHIGTKMTPSALSCEISWRHLLMIEKGGKA